MIDFNTRQASSRLILVTPVLFPNVTPNEIDDQVNETTGVHVPPPDLSDLSSDCLHPWSGSSIRNDG